MSILRSSVESALTTNLLQKRSPSDLAVEAIVSGTPAIETLPIAHCDMDVAWSDGAVPGSDLPR